MTTQQVIDAMNEWAATADVEIDNWFDFAVTLPGYSPEYTESLRADKALFALIDGAIISGEGDGWQYFGQVVTRGELAGQLGVDDETLAGFTGHLPSGWAGVTQQEADEIRAIWEHTVEGVYYATWAEVFAAQEASVQA